MMTIRLKKSERLVFLFITIAVFLAGIIIFALFIPTASIHITRVTEPIVATFEITLDPSLNRISPGLSSIPAVIVVKEDKPLIDAMIGKGWRYDDTLISNTYAYLYKYDDLNELASFFLSKFLSDDKELLRPIEVRIIKGKQFSNDFAIAMVRASGVSALRLGLNDGFQGRYLYSKKLEQYLISKDGVSQVKIVINPNFWPFLPIRSKDIQVLLDRR